MRVTLGRHRRDSAPMFIFVGYGLEELKAPRHLPTSEDSPGTGQLPTETETQARHFAAGAGSKHAISAISNLNKLE